MEDSNFRKGDAKTAIFGSEKMLQASPVDKIPDGPTTPEIAYQMVKDETFAQTQPRLNLATFVTTYMDDYATKLMNEAININYIDETEYPRIAVMNAKCINIVANLWNTPEQAKWKAGALAIGSSEACMLGGVAAWLRWRKKRQAAGKPVDKPNFVISTGFQVVWEKFAQLWQIEMRQVPLTLEKTTLDPEEALKMCDENTICIVPIQGVTWTGLNDDVEALDKALDAYNAKTAKRQCQHDRRVRDAQIRHEFHAVKKERSDKTDHDPGNDRKQKPFQKSPDVGASCLTFLAEPLRKLWQQFF